MSVRSRLESVPLSARLVAIITTLLLLGLALAGFATLSLLQRSLVSEVDSELNSAAQPLAQRVLNNIVGNLVGRPSFRTDDGALPSDYFVQLANPDGSEAQAQFAGTQSRIGIPLLPTIDVAAVTEHGGLPFTVPSRDGSTRWRVVAKILNDGHGTVAVALPLTAADATMDRMRITLLLIALGVVALGSLAGDLAVRRSLRPLRTIESTAEAIAAGDLSRRVPEAPPRTEVGRLSLALNTMLAQIEEAFGARAASQERMRQFVADASHELRTPLAAIRGYSELYRMGAIRTRPAVADTMRRIEDSATRMGTLVEDLLHLARMDEGRPPAQEPVDLSAIARDALSDVRALDPSRSATLLALDGTGDVGPCVVLGDDGRLRQVVMNLVGNAVQHTEAGTSIEIVVGSEGDQGVIEVRDHGAGISPENAGRVFERFYRVDSSRTRESGGSGLGLAIAATIIAVHRGTIEIRQTDGGGATVRCAVPLPVPRLARVPRVPRVERVAQVEQESRAPQVPEAAPDRG
jgi:two-component system OmpR family sensor kinase